MRTQAINGQPAVYNATTPTLVDDQGAALQVDINGNAMETLATRIAGEDLVNDVQKVEERFSYSNITSIANTVVKTGAGFLHCITVNTTAAGTITIYDNTAASGTKIGTMAASIGQNTYFYNVQFATGLTIATAAASDITVSYR